MPDDTALPPPPPSVEELRQYLRALITSAMWEPPGEAVSGELRSLITWAMWEPPGKSVSGELHVSFPKGDDADAP